jgi:alpha-1,3/alpha-1,6-mannosyltransferase
LRLEKAVRIAIVHPSLGYGGAERLVTDACCALAERGHRVTLFTTHVDRSRAFVDLHQVPIRVHGSLLPSDVCGRLVAPASIVRMGYLTACAALARHDLLLIDLVAHVLPLARALTRRSVIYYCHYPDALLAPTPRSTAYALYRRGLDALEERALRGARALLVNSAFTAQALRETFPSVRAPLEIVHPGVDVSTFQPRCQHDDGQIVLLSLARYDPKKDLALAIDTLAALRLRLPPEQFARVRLIHAGGLSEHTPGARQTYVQLRARAQELGLASQVELRTSISDAEKLSLLQRARALVFTPEREHFGIVPLEAMACGVPVVASASGGPRETIVDGVTGFLCAHDAQAFAQPLARLIRDPAQARWMGEQATAHVRRTLSRGAFGERLEGVLAQYA